MAQVKFKEIEVDGKLFDVYVSEWRGEFKVVPRGEKPEGSEVNVVASDFVYDKLLPQLKRKVKEAGTRVSVPFAKMDQGVLRMGVARGIHASKGTVLVTWSNGVKDELERYVRDTYDIPPQEVIEKANELSGRIVRLRDEAKTLEKELEAVLKPYAQRPDFAARGVDTKPTIKELVQAAITATITKSEKAPA